MAKLIFLTAFFGILSATSALPELARREILTPLPQKADNIELKFQPYFDFDSDGCYQTAAIDPSGKLNAGKKIGGTPQGQCRDKIQLDHANTYSRMRCNHGVCGIIYEYYYEKDQASLGPGSAGHTHDFENVVVFVKGDKILRVAPSCHGKYEQNKDKDFPLDGSHPMMVYHKDGGSTHCNRFANSDDIKKPENPTGKFFRAPLVGWNGWPNTGLRDKMNNNDWHGPTPKTREKDFAGTLKAAGAEKFGLDPNHDG